MQAESDIKDVRYTQSLPPKLHEMLEEEAAKMTRSKSAQVVHILKERYGLVDDAIADGEQQKSRVA